MHVLNGAQDQPSFQRNLADTVTDLCFMLRVNGAT